jgi:hypothetical protein
MTPMTIAAPAGPYRVATAFMQAAVDGCAFLSLGDVRSIQTTINEFD